MKKPILAMLACTLAAASALAAPPHEQPRTDKPFRFVVTAGLTTGGDKLADIDYVNGYSTSIKGGGLVQVGAGVQYHPALPMSVLATINYHVDNATARNGDVRFDRVPLELLAFYQPNNRWRIGGGWRHTMNARYKDDIDNQPHVTIDYKDADSLVLQVGYGTERFWGGLRYVNESFDVERLTVTDLPRNTRFVLNSRKSDGSHIGLFGYAAF